tara:strand:- start:431 stop:712 length:282 start_codon:yes stop_codon:yes gene_type:complete
MKPDGTSHDNILVKRNMDGMDAMQGIETLTALALAKYWDAPNGGKTMDEDYEYEKDKVLAERSAAGWVLCTACGVDVHDEDIAEGTGCDCTDV